MPPNKRFPPRKDDKSSSLGGGAKRCREARSATPTGGEEEEAGEGEGVGEKSRLELIGEIVIGAAVLLLVDDADSPSICIGNGATG